MKYFCFFISRIPQYFEFTALASLFINDYPEFSKLAQQRHSQIIFLFYILAKLPQIYLVPTPMPRSKRIIFLPPAFVVVSYSASRLNLKQNSSVRISNEWMKQRLSKIRPNSRQYFCHTFLAPLNPPYENHIKDGFPKNGNFRTIFTTLRALLKSGLCATPLLYSRSDTSS